MNGYYDVAQICLNGHMVNSLAHESPQHNQKFCDKCGAPTLMECPNCKINMRGYYNSDIVVLGGNPTPAPAYCHECGKPYPWTEAKIEAAQEMVQEIDELSSEDKVALSESIADIVKDTPRTPIGAKRFNKFMGKVQKETAAAFKEILISVVSEGVKRSIWS